MHFYTIKEATAAWVETFNAIPMSVIEKLYEANYDDLCEITPASLYDRVYIKDGEYDGQYGEVVSRNDDGSLVVRLDASAASVPIDPLDLEPQFDDHFPIWGTMWAFSDSIDNDWLSGEFDTDGLQLMADCGFRVFESEDYGYVFGIDGAGYDFFEQHWIPLYKARGLHWHDTDA